MANSNTKFSWTWTSSDIPTMLLSNHKPRNTVREATGPGSHEGPMLPSTIYSSPDWNTKHLPQEMGLWLKKSWRETDEPKFMIRAKRHIYRTWKEMSESCQRDQSGQEEQDGQQDRDAGKGAGVTGLTDHVCWLHLSSQSSHDETISPRTIKCDYLWRGLSC